MELTDLNHSFDRLGCFNPDVNRNLDLILVFPQRLQRIFKRDLIHVWAPYATKPEHVLPGIRSGDVLAHRAFGQQ